MPSVSMNGLGQGQNLIGPKEILHFKFQAGDFAFLTKIVTNKRKLRERQKVEGSLHKNQRQSHKKKAQKRPK